MKKYIFSLFTILILSFLITPNVSLAQSTSPTDTDPNPSASCVSIQNNLRYRDRDSAKSGEVSTLQDFLQSKGYLNSEPTGYMGLLTFQAVKDYQKSKGISPTGYVGPSTRAAIAGDCGGGNPDPVLPPSSDGCLPGYKYSPTTGKPCDDTATVTPVTSSIYDTFAQCLASKNLTLYSASWCPHCQAQKALFGDSFKYLSYVECSNSTSNFYQNKMCVDKNIIGYPTWIDKDGTKYEGEQSLEKLSQISNCALPTATTNNDPVISGVSGPQSLNVGQQGTWTVNASNPNGGILSYSVDWGDIQKTCSSSGATCSTAYQKQIQQSAMFTHSYFQAGNYTVMFTVTNSSGQSAKTSLSVKVGNVENIPSLTVSLDSSTPIAQTITAGRGNVIFARIKITAGSQNVSNLNAIQIGSDLPNSVKLNNIRVYENDTQIGTTNYSLSYNGSYYQSWVYLKGAFIIPANTSKILSIMADTSPSGSGLFFTGNVRLGIAGWNFDSPGARVSPSGTAIYGNEFNVVSSTDSTSSVTVLSPNGGETLVKKQSTHITWKGGTYPVQVGIVYDNFPQNRIIVGWINTGANADGYLDWDTDRIGSLDYLTSGNWWNISPGRYKIIVVAKSSGGNYCFNDSGNCVYDVSDNYFTVTSSIVPTEVLSNPVLNTGTSTRSQNVPVGSNGANDIVKAVYDISAGNSGVTISEIKYVALGSTPNPIKSIRVGSVSAPVICYMGATCSAYLTGLNIVIPGNTTKSIEAYLSYAGISINGLSSGATAQVQMTYVKYSYNGITSSLNFNSEASPLMTLLSADPTPTNSSPVMGSIGYSPSVIYPGQAANFNFNATDANNDDLSWTVDWGESPYIIGMTCPTINPQQKQNWTYNVNHTWNTSGTYNVKVTVSDCKDGIATSNFTIKVVDKVVTTLPVPKNFVAAGTSASSIRLSWDLVQDATNYSLRNENTGSVLYNGNETAYIASGLSCGTMYTYSLYASNSVTKSDTVSAAAMTSPCVSIVVPSTSTTPSFSISSLSANALGAVNGLNEVKENNNGRENVSVSSQTSCGKFTDNILAKGMNSEEVRCLQKKLNEKGFKVEGVESGKETSYFGYATLMALKKFQTANGLRADGIFGPASSTALLK